MMNPERSAILLAFETENDVLTKRQILDRSKAPEIQLNYCVDMKLIAMREWQPKVPRLYFLTPHGRDKRDECVVGD